jgi:integrase
MCLFWQDDIWWYEFTIDRNRYRSSTCTTDREVALKVEAEHRVSLKLTGQRVSETLVALKRARAEERCTRRWIQAGIETKRHVIETPQAPQARGNICRASTLQEAAEFLLAWGSIRWAKKTMEYNRAAAERLIEFFGAETKLKQFNISHFERYQVSRSKTCGASALNRELQFLSRLLTRVDLWHKIKRHYVRLKEADWRAPRIFTAEEQERIFAALESEPDLELGRIVFTLTRNSTASGCELRGLKLQSLELEADPPRFHITRDSTKNSIRPRVIPLNDAALKACRDAVSRAARLGSHQPTDYLFPLRVDKATWDPKRRASSSWLVKQTQRLRLVTGIEHINPHTFRHLAVTELLERGASEQTVVAIAGWSSPRMFATYSHARLGAKIDALNLLGPGKLLAPTPPVRQSQTSQQHDQSQPSRQTDGPQVSLDLMNPVIQAEIALQVARQVALAIQRERGEKFVPRAETPASPHLFQFPRKRDKHD